MPWKKMPDPFETLISNDKLEIVNWTHSNCLPCEDQRKSLDEISKSIGNEIFEVNTIRYEDYKKKFKKIGNKQVFPIVNVFYKGKLIKFTDSKLSPTETVPFIAGKRTKKDMLKIIEKTMEDILDH